MSKLPSGGKNHSVQGPLAGTIRQVVYRVITGESNNFTALLRNLPGKFLDELPTRAGIDRKVTVETLDRGVEDARVYRFTMAQDQS